MRPSTKAAPDFVRWVLVAACVGQVCALGQQSADPLAQARSMVQSGKVAEAASAVRSYLESHSTSADGHYLLGYVLFREGKPKESLAEIEAGSKFGKPHADEFRVIASDYVVLKDFQDADKWFSRVVAEEPNDATSWYLLGRTKYNENEYPAAIENFEHALALRPKYVEAENNLGLCWKETNQLDKARTAFQSAIEWQGNAPSDGQPFLNLGTLLADSGQNAEALPYLDQAAVLAPRNPSVHEERGKVNLALGNLQRAQTEYEQAVTLAPDVPSLHYKLGQVYRKLGMQDRAKQEFQASEKLFGARSSSKTPNPLSLKSSQPD